MTKLELRSVVVPDKPGKGVRMLSAFQAAGVNFIGIWGYPVGKNKSQIDLVAQEPALLKKTAKQLKIDLGKKKIVFHITGEDHPGALAQILAKLAAKNINVYAVQALCAGSGHFGAIVQVDQGDVKKTAKALA
jgi:prephenate dehydratase